MPYALCPNARRVPHVTEKGYILSTIAGGDGWEDMENYGISKQQWLQKFLDLPNGIPSDDTFRWVCEKLDPKILEQKLAQWVKQLMGPACQQLIPIDGKSFRGSYDRKNGVNNLHLVTEEGEGKSVGTRTS